MRPRPPRTSGLAFMAPLIPRVLDGSKTVTRRGSTYLLPGDRVYIREPWRTVVGLDNETPSQIAGTYVDPPVWFQVDSTRKGEWGEWDHTLGKYRHARFMPEALARPWRGLVLDVRSEPLGQLDDEDAVREGALQWKEDGPDGTPSELARSLGRPVWSLDGVTCGDTPRDAFLSGWARLHFGGYLDDWDLTQPVVRIEWDPCGP